MFINHAHQGALFIVVLWVGMILGGCHSADDGSRRQSSAQTGKKAMKDQAEATQQRIVCFGNSLTYGYGLDDPPQQSYPGQLANMLDSLGFTHYDVVNAGLSGETTSGGRSRLDWVLERNPNLAVFILELGANDGLRGIPPEETQKNLHAIIDTVQAQYPDAHILLCGMRVPPNMGPDYAQEFRRIFKEVAESQSVSLLPFLLEGVAGNPKLNQDDGIHPTAEGHRRMARNVWRKLEPLIEKQHAESGKNS